MYMSEPNESNSIASRIKERIREKHAREELVEMNIKRRF